MIDEFLVGVACKFIIWVASLFPDWSVPSLDPSAGFQKIVEQVQSLGVWVPFGVLTTCVAVVVAAWLVTLSIKTVRAIIAHIPEIGGAGD